MNSVIPLCIANIIVDYAEEKQLLKWIDISSINRFMILINPITTFLPENDLDKIKQWYLSNGRDFSRSEVDEIYWDKLSENINTVFLLENNMNKIDGIHLSCNPSAIFIIESDFVEVYWFLLSSNKSAIHLLRDNMYKIEWIQLSSNPAAIFLLEANKSKLDWGEFAYNTAAVYSLETKPNITDYCLSKNLALTFLFETNPDKIHWRQLSENSSAVHLLRDNKCYNSIFSIPAVFQSNKCEIYRRLTLSE